MITVEGLWKVFGQSPERVFEDGNAGKNRETLQSELGLVLALREIAFKVRPGEIFVIMGLSGSGKSTLVRCLIRLIEPDRGRIVINDTEVCELPLPELRQFRRETFGMVFQHYALLPHRRVLDNVAYGLEIQGMDRAERHRAAAEAIHTVGLAGWEDYLPQQMSGGMQQRVGLARALAVDPQILLMDEPFSGLDPLIRREMQDELLALQANMRKTIVFITHDLDEALKLGDRIAIMRDGEIIQQGSPERIVTAPRGGYVREFVQDVSRAKVVPVRSIMTAAIAIATEDQAPQSVLEQMERRRADAVHLTASDARLLGTVNRRDVLAWAGGGHRTLHGIPSAQTTSVDPSTPVQDVIGLAARAELPIPVAGDDGRLLGQVHRLAVLATLATAPAKDKNT